MVFITISSNYGQKISADKVPAVVTNAFNVKFSSAKDVKWEMEKSGNFEAEFKLNRVEYSANFDQNGKWLKTETEIEVSQLPKGVTDAIAKEFAGYKIDEAEMAVTFDNKITYEIEAKKDKEQYEVKFSPEGNILKKEVETDDND